MPVPPSWWPSWSVSPACSPGRPGRTRPATWSGCRIWPGGKARRWSFSRSSSPSPSSGSARRSALASCRAPWRPAASPGVAGAACHAPAGRRVRRPGRRPGGGARAVVAANVIYEALDQGTNPGIDQPTLATVSGSPGVARRVGDDGALGSRLRRGRHQPRPAPRLSRGRCRGSRSDPRLRRHADGRHDRGASGRRGARAGARGWLRAKRHRGVGARRVGLDGPERGSGSRAAARRRHGDRLHPVLVPAELLQPRHRQQPGHQGWRGSSSTRFTSGGPRMPEQDRPRLIVFGASLGAGGAETPFLGSDAAASVANFASRADGALLVGSLGWNPILRQLTEAREPELPGVAADLCGWRDRPLPDRRQPARRRHALEPVTGALPAAPVRPGRLPSLDSLWSPPEWMDEPRGRGVPPATGWFPIVSAVQAAADLSFASSLPSGFGHDYRVDYVDAFARIAPPEAWTDEDTRPPRGVSRRRREDRCGSALTDLSGEVAPGSRSPRRGAHRRADVLCFGTELRIHCAGDRFTSSDVERIRTGEVQRMPERR